MPGAEWESVRSLTARGMERAAGGRCYSGCGPSFAGTGIAGSEVMPRLAGPSGGEPKAVRPVMMRLFAERPNRRDRARPAGGAVGVAPDPPAYTSRGAHVGGAILAEGFSATWSRPGIRPRP